MFFRKENNRIHLKKVNKHHDSSYLLLWIIGNSLLLHISALLR